MLPLHGRTAVISGGSGGIGLAIARRFARYGANVVITGRSADKIQAALKQLRRDQHARPRAYQVHKGYSFDAGNSTGWEALVKQHPSIDILVNCAGQTQRKILFRTEDPEITEILESNLRSAILGCRVVGRQMLRPTPGSNSDQAPFSKCIINVSSLLAHRAVQGTAVYAATKAGMLGLTASLANELGRRGIRVNAIVPGYIETAMTKDIDGKELLEKIPLGRFGRPEEVAEAAHFLVKNTYANNCVLNLDGGLGAVV